MLSAMGKKMITPQEFATRIGRPYQTVMYWLRNKLVPGAVRVEQSRGPVYSVPEDQVARFKKQGPKRGRPVSAVSKKTSQAPPLARKKR